MGGGMKSSRSSSQLTELGAGGGAVRLDEPPVLCDCQVLSPKDLPRLLRLVCGMSPPKIHTNLRKFGIDLLITSVSSGVIIVYNYTIILKFKEYGLQITIDIRSE